MKRHKNLKKRDSKFVVINNNVNTSWLRSLKISYEFKKKNDYINLIFIGNADNKRKGLFLLLKVAKKLIDSGHKIQLQIIGSGKLLKKYKKEYEKYKNIKFLGYLENPFNELINSDLLIIPSLEDSFPNTIIEAIFFGIPVIGSDRGGIPEILKYSELIFSIDESELYNKISNIIQKNTFHHLQKLIIKRKEFFTFDWIEDIRTKIF